MYTSSGRIWSQLPHPTSTTWSSMNTAGLIHGSLMILTMPRLQCRTITSAFGCIRRIRGAISIIMRIAEVSTMLRMDSYQLTLAVLFGLFATRGLACQTVRPEPNAVEVAARLRKSGQAGGAVAVLSQARGP